MHLAHSDYYICHIFFSMVSGKEKTSAKTEWQKHLVDIYLPTLETQYNIAVIYSQ